MAIDFESIYLPTAVDFGGGVPVSRWLTATDFDLAFDSDSGVLLALHRRTRRALFIWPASGAYGTPHADSLPAAFQPKPLNGDGGRRAPPRRPG